ncbi:MAG: hypothetical protein NT061_11455 [Spirochaetes bacterium]|nr:hypothetical protein [Spirochaetota bacterium]
MPALRRLALCFLAGLCATTAGFAQEGGFGFGAESDQAPAPALTLRGTVGVGSTIYLDKLTVPGLIDLGSLASASLDLLTSGTVASAQLRLKLSRTRFETDPGSVIDEAKVALFLGPVDLDAGLLKLNWGRAESGGPLDVPNPLDLRDLSITNSLERKLAVPMIHFRLSIGQNSSVEAVFEPGFRGDAIALSGKWMPAAIKTLLAGGAGTISTAAADVAAAWTLDHSQGGVRFTTILGGIDLGAQYHYGYLREPVIYHLITGTPTVTYVRRHQIGLDFAAVLAGFSLRGEAAANLTADLAGNDSAVPNPSLAFSFGFDRNLFADLALGFQYEGSLRLADGGVSLQNDVEYGTYPLASTLTGSLSETLLKGALTLNFAADWGVENGDYLFRPSAVLNFGEGEMGLYGGFYGGSSSGKLGQYADASYLKAGITYKF